MMTDTDMGDPDSDNVLLLDSDYYPMTTANKFYDLICQSAVDESLKKKSAPVVINQSVLTSAFKFLAYYNKNKKSDQQKGGGNSRKTSQKNFKSKSCLTVFSSPYQSRKPEISTELPSYVKKMMEKDASLRRLLKTGNVTISHIPHNAIDHSLDVTSDDDFSSTKFLLSCRTTERTNCQGSNLLKKLAKKASEVSTQESELSNPDSSLDVRAAVATLRLQHPSKPKAKVKPPARKQALRKNRTNNFRLQEIIAGQSQDVTPQFSQDSDFDPTRFLEISFREEESDEHRRKYKCTHCVKKFCWSTDLKRHILTHTGERPFSCEFCSANFTRKFLMQKHMRKHHQDQLLKNIKIPAAQVHNGNGYARSTSKVNVKNEILVEAVEVEAEDYVEDDDMEAENVHDGNSDSEQPSGSYSDSENPVFVAEAKPIVINVFSSMNGNSSSEYPNSASMFRGEDSYASLAAPRRINQSIVKQITKANLNRCQPSVEGRKLSMLIPS